LNGWRKFRRPHAQQLLLAPGAREFNRCLVAIHEDSSLRIKQPDRIDASLEKVLEHGATVPEQLLGRTGSSDPVIV
jgi:hypothetical protein